MIENSATAAWGAFFGKGAKMPDPADLLHWALTGRKRSNDGGFSRSPYVLLLALMAATFVAEWLIMTFIFDGSHHRNLLDALLVSAVVFVTAYILMARPLAGVIDELETRERLLQSVFREIPAGIVLTDARPSIVAVNPAFTAITGYPAEEAVGRNPRLLSSGRHDDGFYAGMWQTLDEQGCWCGDIWNRRKDGGLYLERLSISAIRDRKGRPLHYVGILFDITLEHKAQQNMIHRATHDVLTGLPNRVLFRDRVEQLLREAGRTNRRFAVMLLDLDGFKPINDQYGHLVGDRVLQEVARRIKGNLRGSDTAARLGGDEFVLVVTDAEGQDADLATASKLLHALAAPIDIEGQAVLVSVSIGVARHPGDGDDVDTLLARADEAMYLAKRTGKNRIAFS